MPDFPAQARERANTFDNQNKEMEQLVQPALQRLDEAFITPLDREDIVHLMHRVVVAIGGLAQRIVLYGLDKVDPKFTAQADLLAHLEKCLLELVRELRRDPRLSTMRDALNKIRQLRRSAEDMQRNFWLCFTPDIPIPLE